ncbi:MurR/RpiR family transcriptional regulator [Planosporangium mesophilum]|uniref:Sugar isomerase n=1 Tax=Planosporangium mesophilum TaxID=689768 RepID=A0A8J3TBG8_9ACTN|nr:MurR/RpiR family transcriptional regulator [Planosporangium mesophilum]NJC84415.1 MurR/RpiR family transcriptional regulator [Planosporangium mesophilum]GII23443.1 sugar isomerase [Planosporangium mesophilum]
MAGSRNGAPADEQRPTVAQQTRSSMQEFSAAERKVARALLAEYPGAGLDTVANLAGRAGVSAPTVLRFGRRLGYQGFPELQAALRAELARRSSGPLARFDARRPAGSASELVRQEADARGRAVAASLEAITPYEIDAAVALTADRSRRVTLAGGRFSHVLAEYLELYLQQLRPKTRLLDSSPPRRVAQLLDVGRNDVFVLFDYRRYQRDIVSLAEQVRGRGASVVLFTDPWLSPAAAHADVVLPTGVDSPSPFDSLAAGFVLVEIIASGVLAVRGDAATQRMRDWDSYDSWQYLP